MKVYVAAPWVRKQDAIAAAGRLRGAGITVTSQWFDHGGDPNDSTGESVPDAEIRDQAIQDYNDVARADYVMVLNLEKSEGKAVETGFAIAMNKPFICVGPRSNIFQVLGAGMFQSVEDAVAYLKGVEQAETV